MSENLKNIQNDINTELKEMDNPFKLILGLGKIKKVLEEEIFNLAYELKKNLNGEKADFYGVFYDLLDEENKRKSRNNLKGILKKIGKVSTEKEYSELKINLFDIKNGFFSKYKIEDYKNFSEDEKKEKIKNYFIENDDDFKDKQNNGTEEEKKKDLEIRFKEVEKKLKILGKRKEFLQIGEKIKYLTDNFAFSIYGYGLLLKLNKGLKDIDNEIINILDVFLSFGVSKNYEEYLIIKKFFIQLNEIKNKKIESFLKQNLAIIFLVILSIIFLPIAINGIILVIWILSKIKNTDFIKQKLISWNFGFSILSIIIIFISSTLLISTFKMDNLVILSNNYKVNEKINKLFLLNPIDYFRDNFNKTDEKCFEFDYLKEKKSCFEK